MLTQKEQVRFTVINQVLKREITNGKAAALLGISPRQVRRLRIGVKRDGALAIIHKLKRKPSNHQLSNATGNHLSIIHGDDITK